jgi:membrane protein
MGGSAARMAFLATADINQPELQESVRALERTGLQVDVIGAQEGASPADGVPIDHVDPEHYSALALPDSLMKGKCIPDDASELVQSMKAAGKSILYVSMGPSVPSGLGRHRDFSLKQLLMDSLNQWIAINSPRLGAALAYYTLLSLSPLLVLIISLIGSFFQRSMAQSGVIAQVQQLFGSTAVEVVNSILAHSTFSTGVVATAISIVVCLLSASGLFLELRDDLDVVWGVKPTYGTGLLSLVRERAFAFVVIIGVGALVAIFMLLSVVLSTPARYVLSALPPAPWVTQTVSTGISLVAMTVVFAIIYKTIPDTYIRWSDVWIGALVTSALFTTGKAVIGLYLSTAGLGSAYAAAGSVVVFLTWVYYSAQIFLLGAEFTHVYAFRHGTYSKPKEVKRLGRGN